MIEYVFQNNIDDRIIHKAKNCLTAGGIIAYPTDTSWGLGCSSHSKSGIEKLTKIKGDIKNYTFSLICSNISQVSEVAELSNPNFRFIKKYIPVPYVFILPALDTIEKKINMKRIEIGVRIPENPVPIKLIEALNCPLFSMTASRIMTDISWWDAKFAEENLFEFGYEVEDIQNIDFVIDTGERLPKVLTTVINLTGEVPEIIRQGIGKL